MTLAQFDALAQLLRLRDSPSRVVARLVLVDEVPIGLAAQAAGMSQRCASTAVGRVRAGLDLAKRAVL